MARPEGTEPFASFWMGGFEGADHVNRHGVALDMNALSGHVHLLAEDYQRVARLGMKVVRESAGWRLCAAHASPPHGYDFGRLRQVATIAEGQGLQVLWTLMHYGLPEGVRLTGHDFVARFAEFAGQAAREIRRVRGTASIYTPINEIGFLAWAYTQSHLLGGRRGTDAGELDGFAVKCRLVEAALAGIDAIRREDPGARFLHVEPLIHVVAAEDRPDLTVPASTFSAYQWQAWDLLLGRLKPELGGNARSTDFIGVNHYHDSQWELPSGQALDWRPAHPGRRTFDGLLHEAWRRYRLPLLITETSHVGEHRAGWLETLLQQTDRALAAGVPVQGICLYPVTDRPDWNDAEHWHRCGLWDCGEGDNANLLRRPVADYTAVVQRSQHRWRESAQPTSLLTQVAQARPADEFACELVPEPQCR